MLSPDKIRSIAASLGVEAAAVQAVLIVESSNKAFYADGRKSPRGFSLSRLPVILFEPHIFYRQLPKQRPPYNPEGLLSRADVKAAHPEIATILYKTWKTLPYGSTYAQYDRLALAAAICRPAALESCSWGAFQIMGYHWGALSYHSIEDFVQSMDTLDGQVEAFVRYIKANNLVHLLKSKDWLKFALAYNGQGQAKNNYSGRMAEEYAKAKKAGI